MGEYSTKAQAIGGNFLAAYLHGMSMGLGEDGSWRFAIQNAGGTRAINLLGDAGRMQWAQDGRPDTFQAPRQPWQMLDQPDIGRALEGVTIKVGSMLSEERARSDQRFEALLNRLQRSEEAISKAGGGETAQRLMQALLKRNSYPVGGQAMPNAPMAGGDGKAIQGLSPVTVAAAGLTTGGQTPLTYPLGEVQMCIQTGGILQDITGIVADGVTLPLGPAPTATIPAVVLDATTFHMFPPFLLRLNQSISVTANATAAGKWQLYFYSRPKMRVAYESAGPCGCDEPTTSSHVDRERDLQLITNVLHDAGLITSQHAQALSLRYT